jgi:hypothetical protein
MLTRVVKTMGFALHLGRVVDLAHGLVGLVHGVDEGQAHMARLHVELGQDGVAEGFGGDAGAVGDKNGARVHGQPTVGASPPLPVRGAYNGAHYSNFIPIRVGQQPQQQSRCSVHGCRPIQGPGDPVLTSGAFPCLHFQATALVVPFENLSMTDVESSAARTPASAR